MDDNCSNNYWGAIIFKSDTFLLRWDDCAVSFAKLVGVNQKMTLRHLMSDCKLCWHVMGFT